MQEARQVLAAHLGLEIASYCTYLQASRDRYVESLWRWWIVKRFLRVLFATPLRLAPSHAPRPRSGFSTIRDLFFIG